MKGRRNDCHEHAESSAGGAAKRQQDRVANPPARTTARGALKHSEGSFAETPEGAALPTGACDKKNGGIGVGGGKPPRAGHPGEGGGEGDISNTPKKAGNP